MTPHLHPVPGRVVTARATREGTGGPSADAGRLYTAADLTTAAAIVDGMGHASATVALAPVLAEVAVRVGAARGTLAGLLTAALLVADRGPDGAGPDAVAVLAAAVPGQDTVVAWVGDCRAYGWDGRRLEQYTTDHTVGQQLRANGVPVDLARDHDNWIRVTLERATPATVFTAVIPAHELVLLTSDGVHDQVEPDIVDALVRKHQHSPQDLVEALVAAAAPGDGGYRDDATAVVVLHTAASSGASGVSLQVGGPFRAR
ncbi:hypothetical protein ACWC98_32630 [Streptomyces goshikiensis]